MRKIRVCDMRSCGERVSVVAGMTPLWLDFGGPMRIVKRIIFAIGVVAALALVVAGVGYWRLKVDPEWYRPRAIDPEAARRAANRADQKFADALNWAAGAQAAETRRRLGSTLPSDLAQVKTLSSPRRNSTRFSISGRTLTAGPGIMTPMSSIRWSAFKTGTSSSQVD